MVWFSQLIKNIPQFFLFFVFFFLFVCLFVFVIHTFKGFCIVNEAEVDFFNSLEFSMIQHMLAI